MRAARLRNVLLAASGLLAFAGPVLADPTWVSHPEFAGPERNKEAVSLQFRREIDLPQVPSRLDVKISADNRYVLYVNGRRIDGGPSRGDLANWRFRRIDLAPFLKRGVNVIAVQVWNDGKAAGAAQISSRTGFWLDAEAEPAIKAQLESSSDWKVRIDRSRTVTPAQPGLAQSIGWKYFAAPPPETLRAAEQTPAWLAVEQSTADWQAAAPALGPAETTPWHLVEDRLPQMRLEPLAGGKVVRFSGIRETSFPSKAQTIPANSEVILRLDTGDLRAAYPRLVTSGGKGATIDLTYAEAPYGTDLEHLPDRGDGINGWVLGLTDHFLPNGGKNETFSPYWWRAWRYAELKIRTAEEPLRLESFTRTATGYPFDQKGSFTSDDPELRRIWQIGWNTAKLDAHETYMDTAYWEQLQYVGDTRIQALVSYAVSGDARLARQALDAFAASKTDGIIQSRWPADIYQSIPPFALLWVGMIHDYWMYQPDSSPLKANLPAMRSSLEWYARYVQPDGLVGTTSGWEFIDWRTGIDNYPETKDPRDTERCIISLMYLGALQQAGDLETAIGNPALAQPNRDRAVKLSDAIRRGCWSAEKGMFADQPAKTSYSQHANMLAVIYDVVPKSEQQALLEKVLVPGNWPEAPKGIIPATFYFDFYLARALDHAGMADRYLDMLKPWRTMLKQNFVTVPESPDPTRSDTHAWSAHPTFDLITIVGGIRPDAPGFARVMIAPKLGKLRSVDATYPHPRGAIRVKYRVTQKNGLDARIEMPAGLEGTFRWNGQDSVLQPGLNLLVLPAVSK